MGKSDSTPEDVMPVECECHGVRYCPAQSSLPSGPPSGLEEPKGWRPSLSELLTTAEPCLVGVWRYRERGGTIQWCCSVHVGSEFFDLPPSDTMRGALQRVVDERYADEQNSSSSRPEAPLLTSKGSAQANGSSNRVVPSGGDIGAPKTSEDAPYLAGENVVPGKPPKRPTIVCLCGSTRFIEQFAIKTWELEREGFIVLGCTLLPTWYCQVPDHFGEHTGTKEQCDELHLRKIDLADEVLVLNIGGYIGESTRNEIAYANAHNKPVRFVEEPPVGEE